MRIAVLEIPQQGDERNDFSALSGFDGKLTLSDWTVTCGFFRRFIVFLLLVTGFYLYIGEVAGCVASRAVSDMLES